MGIYDREYYQDDRPSGFHVGGSWPMVGKLIALNVAVYVIDIFAGRRLMMLLAASPESLAEPWKLWQLLTYGFAHDQSQVGHIFWNMFTLYIFGRDVEGVYGGKEFLRIFLVTLVVGGLIWSARSLVTVPPEYWGAAHVLGASGAVTAVTLLFCLHFPHRTILLMFVLPVPAWAIGMLVIVVNVLGLVAPDQRTAFDVHLVGAAFAVAYYKFGWNLGGWVPSWKLSPPRRWLRRQPKLKVHDPEQAYRDQDDEADALLDKVKRDGIDSLSARERRVLEDYSRRMRQKHR